MFFGLDLPFPVAGIDYKAKKAEIIGTGKELFSLTHLDDIGRFVCACLKSPEVTKNTCIRIAGDTQSADALVQKLQKLAGGKFDVSYQDAVQLKQTLKKAIDDEDYGLYFSNAIPLFTGSGVRISSMHI